jgi:hypothetical protein
MTPQRTSNRDTSRRATPQTALCPICYENKSDRCDDPEYGIELDLCSFRKQAAERSLPFIPIATDPKGVDALQQTKSCDQVHCYDDWPTQYAEFCGRFWKIDLNARRARQIMLGLLGKDAYARPSSNERYNSKRYCANDGNQSACSERIHSCHSKPTQFRKFSRNRSVLACTFRTLQWGSRALDRCER